MSVNLSRRDFLKLGALVTTSAALNACAPAATEYAVNTHVPINTPIPRVDSTSTPGALPTKDPHELIKRGSGGPLTVEQVVHMNGPVYAEKKKVLYNQFDYWANKLRRFNPESTLIEDYTIPSRTDNKTAVPALLVNEGSVPKIYVPARGIYDEKSPLYTGPGEGALQVTDGDQGNSLSWDEKTQCIVRIDSNGKVVEWVNKQDGVWASFKKMITPVENYDEFMQKTEDPAKPLVEMPNPIQNRAGFDECFNNMKDYLGNGRELPTNVKFYVGASFDQADYFLISPTEAQASPMVGPLPKFYFKDEDTAAGRTQTYQGLLFTAESTAKDTGYKATTVVITDSEALGVGDGANLLANLSAGRKVRMIEGTKIAERSDWVVPENWQKLINTGLNFDQSSMSDDGYVIGPAIVDTF